MTQLPFLFALCVFVVSYYFDELQLHHPGEAKAGGVADLDQKIFADLTVHVDHAHSGMDVAAK